MQTQWEPWRLSEAGEEISSRSIDFVALAEGTVTQIREAGAHWSGDAYYAAYDRIASDRDLAKKVADETNAVARELITGGRTLTGYRQALLDRVTDATTAGFTVSENWTVTASVRSDSHDDQSLNDHQTAITTALNEMLAAQTGIATAIEQATGDVKTQSEQLGSGDPIEDATSSLTSQPNSEPNQTLSGQPDSTTSTSASEQPGGDPKTSVVGTSVSQNQSTGTSSESTNTQSTLDSGKPIANTSAKKDGENADDKGNGGKGNEGENKNQKTTPDSTPKPEAPKSTGAASDPNSWKPSDVTALITAVGTIAGKVPDLLTAVGTLEHNFAEVVKASGDAGKILIEASGAAAGNLATAADKVITSVDHAVNHTSSSAQSTPAASNEMTANPPANTNTTTQHDTNTEHNTSANNKSTPHNSSIANTPLATSPISRRRPTPPRTPPARQQHPTRPHPPALAWLDYHLLRGRRKPGRQAAPTGWPYQQQSLPLRRKSRDGRTGPNHARCPGPGRSVLTDQRTSWSTQH
ncbi:hypothetical protein AB0E01_03220 [Nocardia vinacea]|uniref:hypothetical protein n=1 Tax=Nocardia vinacea TaxID=96468 RepID=UPI00340BB978